MQAIPLATNLSNVPWLVVGNHGRLVGHNAAVRLLTYLLLAEFEWSSVPSAAVNIFSPQPCILLMLLMQFNRSLSERIINNLFLTTDCCWQPTPLFFHSHL